MGSYIDLKRARTDEIGSLSRLCWWRNRRYSASHGDNSTNPGEILNDISRLRDTHVVALDLRTDRGLDC